MDEGITSSIPVCFAALILGLSLKIVPRFRFFGLMAHSKLPRVGLWSALLGCDKVLDMNSLDSRLL